MTNRDLKNIRDAIHDDLKICPQNTRSSCFIVREEKKESPIQKIEFTFRNQDDVLIVRQKENTHTINMLQNFETHFSCDFIVFIIDGRGDIKIYFCEIKPSYKREYLEKAIKQIQSSKLFLQYMIECYLHYTQNNCLKSCDIKSKSHCYYIYPKINTSNKKKVYKDNLCVHNLILKPLKVDNRIARVCEKDINDFFGI